MSDKKKNETIVAMTSTTMTPMGLFMTSLPSVARYGHSLAPSALAAKVSSRASAERVGPRPIVGGWTGALDERADVDAHRAAGFFEHARDARREAGRHG